MTTYRAKQVPDLTYEVFQWSQRLTGPNASFVKRCTGGQYGKPLVAVPEDMEVFGMTSPGVWINGAMIAVTEGAYIGLGTDGQPVFCADSFTFETHYEKVVD